MESEKAKTIQEMFTRIAPTYDLLNRSLSANIDQIWRKKAISYLPKKENLKVLDLCAGTLDLTLAILKKHPSSSITSLDFSAKMRFFGRITYENRYSHNIKRLFLPPKSLLESA